MSFWDTHMNNPQGEPPLECEHENLSSAPEHEKKCPECGMVFVYCHPCSEAGGAESPVYHTPPPCPSKP
jgi:hypothetical protein